jgi:diguanylate cyclase (GGDEF)-like protein
MKITRAVVVEPGAAVRRKLKQGLEQAGLTVSAVAEWEEPGRAHLVVLGPSLERAPQVARVVRRQLPQALVLAAQQQPGRAAFADGVLPLPVSPRDLRVRLPELVKLRAPAPSAPARKPRSAATTVPDVVRKGESILDPLTQFYSFTPFKDFIFIEVKRAKRYGLPLAVALVAYDPLPVPPDGELRAQLYGGLALAIRRSLRDTDYPVQYSSERVLLLLPHTDLAGAVTVARRVCERVARAKLAWDDQVLRPTVSVGLAAVAPGRDVSFAELIRQAQSSLDVARAGGGNRVEMLAETPGAESDETGT